MKTHVLLAVILVIAQSGIAQFTVTFSNRGGTSTAVTPGQVLAPIYREDPADPTHRISGNTPNGIPAGTTSYNGAPVVAAGQGPTFVASLWGLEGTAATGDAANNNLLLTTHGIAGFRTNLSGTFAGIFLQPNGESVVPGVLSISQRATMQVRVWDTRNGTIADWNDVWASQNNDVLRGYSELFTIPWPLGDPSALDVPPYLQGLESFNVFIVPEPSTWILLALGGIGLSWAMRGRLRKR